MRGEREAATPPSVDAYFALLILLLPAAKHSRRTTGRPWGIEPTDRQTGIPKFYLAWTDCVVRNIAIA